MADQEPVAWISALKRIAAGDTLRSCAVDDADAVFFRVSYRGMRYTSSTIDFRQEDYPHAGMARHRAEQVVSALISSYHAGRQGYARDLRAFMGVKE